ncbi:MAG: hypothetical protein BWY91_01482 [bacterium ADurb.BinA028]|nr:MAG: hypothetical protein BWY91_01482 [bacterium ADurb.BinA028]
MDTVASAAFGVLFVSVMVALNAPPAVGVKLTTTFEAVPAVTVSGTAGDATLK